MNKIMGILFVLALSGCSATSLHKNATHVRITHFKPDDSCRFLGEITGSQGNFLSGRFTSNARLESGARNSLKNQAARMGGNVVVILTQRAGYSGNAYSTRQTNVTVSGNVYKCSHI